MNTCPCCTRDVDASDRTTATDALLVLKFAIGNVQSLDCNEDAGEAVCN